MDFISPLRNRRILYGDVIYALHEGSDGSIWIGTSKGLKHLNPQSLDIREYTIENGLPSNYICAIKEDVNGYLWISTNYGISRFNPKTKVSLISMQVTDCKAMNSAKELALHTIKANLFLEEQTVSPILIQQK